MILISTPASASCFKPPSHWKKKKKKNAFISRLNNSAVVTAATETWHPGGHAHFCPISRTVTYIEVLDTVVG